MAEFVEVMKQAKRMCNESGVECAGCPIYFTSGCYLERVICEKNPASFELDKCTDIEQIVMDWAAANPEPRYPSWKEWWEEKFPNADSLIRPCMFESEEYFGCKNFIGCERCINTPIPADIAEKLGVKPIGGVDDENA